MKSNYAAHVGTRHKASTLTTTRPSKPIPHLEAEMVENAAGGYAFKVDEKTQLNRFLILGTSGGTFYVSEKKLTVENAENIKTMLARSVASGKSVVDTVVEVSLAGRAMKQDAGLFVLALAASIGDKTPTAENIEVRRYALAQLSKVCRTATQLYHFAEFLKHLRGWGRSARKGVASWYENMPVKGLAIQSWKYKSRDGWSHQDLMRLSHPQSDGIERAAIFEYMARPDLSKLSSGLSHLSQEHLGSQVLAQVAAAEELLHIDSVDKDSVKKAVKLITDYSLTHEAVPSALKNEKAVWEALLPHMKLNATLRNLNKMTLIGLLAPLASANKVVLERLSDVQEMKRQRLHPMQILVSLKQYATGRGNDFGKGRAPLTWTPVPALIDAMDEAFYASFEAVEPTGKSRLIAIDTSGSMGGRWGHSGSILGIQGMTPLMAAAAFALVELATEPNAHLIGVDTKVNELNLSRRRMRLDDLFKMLAKYQGGGTNLSLPFEYAKSRNMNVDAFSVYTDGESWAGYQHPLEALLKYRKSHNNGARAINVAMTATATSILPADKYPGCMEVVGCSADLPNMISEFVRGNI